MKKLLLTIVLILGTIIPVMGTRVQADIPQYREWVAPTEIRQWVLSTGIPDREYMPELYDCDDFAIDLFLAGLRDGRLIGLYVVDDGREAHMMNFTIYDDKIYYIDAHDARVKLILKIDKGGPSNDIWGALHDYYNPEKG